MSKSDNKNFHFPTHPMYKAADEGKPAGEEGKGAEGESGPVKRIQPLKAGTKTQTEEEVQEEGEGEGEGGSGEGGLAHNTPLFENSKLIQDGDWEVDLEAMTLHNKKHKLVLKLENLSTHPKYLRLFCAIGIRKDWDVGGLVQVLNQASMKIFQAPLEQVLLKTINEEGKKIDWAHGKIRSMTKPIFSR